MNCPLADQGGADYLAGRKNHDLYNDYERGMDYRRGWQMARLQAAPMRPGQPLAPEPSPTAPQPVKTPPARQDSAESASQPLTPHCLTKNQGELFP